MPGEKSKIQFGLRNVHYAVMLTEGENPTWDTPKPYPGAVSLALDAQGEIIKFYADNTTYWQASTNNGYEGDYESAMIPDDFLMDVFGYTTVPTDNVLTEDAFAKAKPFALMFQVDGDKSNRLHVLYNCIASRGSLGGATTTETIEPQTQTLTISAAPLASGIVRRATMADTSEDVIANWFKKVYEPAV